MLTALSKPDAAAVSQGLKAQKAPARGLVWGCPALGESWGQGGCSWLDGPQGEPPRLLLGLWGRCLGLAPDLSAWVCFSRPRSAFPECSIKCKTNREERKRRRRKKTNLNSETKQVCLGKHLPPAGGREGEIPQASSTPFLLPPVPVYSKQADKDSRLAPGKEQRVNTTLGGSFSEPLWSRIKKHV